MTMVRRSFCLSASVLLLNACGGGGYGDPEPIITAAAADPLARYKLTVSNGWTATAFPTQFPPTAHLTRFVGATHSDTITFWASGLAATLGVKNVAERGRTAEMTAEVMAAIAAGTAQTLLNADAIPLGGTETSLEFTLTQTHSRVSLLSMLGPSPDWFIGLSGMALFENGAWKQSVAMPLKAYDAGTDDGLTFLSPDAPTAPPRTVQALSTATADSDFLNGVNRNNGFAVAAIRFERLM